MNAFGFRAKLDSIGLADVWVNAEFTEGDESVGLKDSFEIESVYLLNEENVIVGTSILGALHEDFEAALLKDARAAWERECRQAAEDAAIERYESELMYREAA